ncbi:MAG: hypothetical protein ACT6FC_00370 [Methanosarcinaceae archaeon]
MFAKIPAFIEQVHDSGKPRGVFGMDAGIVLETIGVVDDGFHS